MRTLNLLVLDTENLFVKSVDFFKAVNTHRGRKAQRQSYERQAPYDHVWIETASAFVLLQPLDDNTTRLFLRSHLLAIVLLPLVDGSGLSLY